MLRIHFVIGPIRSGKNTYIKNNFSPETEVIVAIGDFLRASIGLNAMLKDPSPNVCVVTEEWVRLHVQGALKTAASLDREIVFNGYPRSVGQVRFVHNLLTSRSFLPLYPERDIKIVLHDLQVSRKVLQNRITMTSDDTTTLAFNNARLDASIEGAKAVGDAIANMFGAKGAGMLERISHVG